MYRGGGGGGGGGKGGDKEFVSGVIKVTNLCLSATNRCMLVNWLRMATGMCL